MVREPTCQLLRQWYNVDASVAGNLPELQLHVKLATTSSSLLESQSEDERKTALHLTAQHGSLVFGRLA